MKNTHLCALAALTACHLACAAISPEEMKQLGTTLTPWGAIKAGNAAGTIPAYTGGLAASTSPAGFAKNSGKWPDPFADDKPLYSITGKNVDEYADKLSETTKALLKRYPGFRVDVFPTRRSVAYPQRVIDETLKNATRCKTVNNGLALEGCFGGAPFPIAKTGYEVMWNMLLQYRGIAVDQQSGGWYVDTSGRRTMTAEYNAQFDYPYYDTKNSPEKFAASEEHFYRALNTFTAPAKQVGEALMLSSSIDPLKHPRTFYIYTPAQRRVRLAPDLAYDYPLTSLGGAFNFDDSQLFSGTMDRFDFKLVGTKEMIIPYNTYKLDNAKSDVLIQPGHLNPDLVRWELHRVYIVEATQKAGVRHIYSKRRFYLDEDAPGTGMTDMWDNAGKLYRGLFMGITQAWDAQTPITYTHWGHDLSTGIYGISSVFGDTRGVFFKTEARPASFYTPEALSRQGAR